MPAMSRLISSMRSGWANPELDSNNPQITPKTTIVLIIASCWYGEPKSLTYRENVITLRRFCSFSFQKKKKIALTIKSRLWCELHNGRLGVVHSQKHRREQFAVRLRQKCEQMTDKEKEKQHTDSRLVQITGLFGFR
jgi:hypothetical protein